MGHKAGTWRETHTMYISVHNPKRTDEIDESHSSFALHVEKIEQSVKLRTEGYGEIDGRRKDETSSKKQSSAASVSYETIYKSRKAVYYTIECQEDTKLQLCNSKLCLHGRKRCAEVLAEKIIEDVCDHQDDERPPLPIVVLFPCLNVHVRIWLIVCHAKV